MPLCVFSATPLLPCHMVGIQRCLLISPPLIAELREPFDLDSWHTESPCCRDQVLIDFPGLMGILSVSCISSLIANHRSDFKSNLQSALGQVRCHDKASLSVFPVSLWEKDDGCPQCGRWRNRPREAEWTDCPRKWRLKPVLTIPWGRLTRTPVVGESRDATG